MSHTFSSNMPARHLDSRIFIIVLALPITLTGYLFNLVI